MPKLTTTNCELDLDCYPKVSSHIQQPWDAADLYLIEHASPGKYPAILNDQWGALSCHINSLGLQYYSWTDSFCSQKAISNNLSKLSLPLASSIERVHLEETVSETPSEAGPILHETPKTTRPEIQKVQGAPCFPEKIDTLWIQCPKSFDQLHWWLSLALEQIGSGITVSIAGMAKHIPIKWLNWLEQHTDDYQQFPIQKKARLIQLKLPKQLPPLNVLKSYSGTDNLVLEAPPGVFSRDHMDIGSRFFIHHLSSLPPLVGKVIDLGCGNGLLSIAALQYSDADNIDLILTDDSALALGAAKANLEMRKYTKADFHHTDALLGIKTTADSILCNPPFHTGNRVSTAAAERMFRQATQILSRNGQLLVIANRHLGYAASLKKLFSTVQLLTSDSKFVIYRCRQAKKGHTKHSPSPQEL